MSAPAMNDWLRRGAIAIVAFQVLVPIGLFAQNWTPDPVYVAHSDAGRYQRIAIAHGNPFKTSEYPAGAVLLFKALGPRPFRDFLLRLIALQALAQAVLVAALFWAWGKRAMWSYLVLSAPLLPIVLTKFDLISVAAAVCGTALVVKRRATIGGALMALGVFVKIWPAALLPGLAARKRWGGLATATIVFVGGLAAWVARAGITGVREVVTYRGSRGWHIESVPGSILYLVRRKTPSFTGGSWRVGAPPGWASALLLVGLVATVAWVWLRVARSSAHDLVGIADMTVVGAVLGWSTLFSPQFVIWIVPFVAISAARGHIRCERVTAAIVVLTALGVWATTTDARPPMIQELIYLARNAGLVALTAFGIQALARSPQDLEPA